MKKSTIILLLTLFILTSYTLRNIMLKHIPINENYYTLDRKGMHNPNRPVPPLFHLNEEKIYFIHPAPTINAKATFTFKKPDKLLWHFFIQDGSKVGKILFIVKKNDDDFKKFIVDTKKDYKLKVKVKKDDKITVIADPAGSTAGDWGNLKIYRYEKLYTVKLLSITLLWVLFFAYLISKGYIYIAFSSYFGFLLTLLAEYLTFGPMKFIDVSVYTVFFFLFAFLFVLIYQELKTLKKLKIATILKLVATLAIFIIPTIFIVFYLIFKKPIDWNILYAIYQTNFDEAIGFIKSFVPFYYLLAILVFIIIIGYIFWHQEKKERVVIERSLLILVVILLIGVVSRELLKARLPNFIYTTYLDYYAQIEHLLEFQKKRKASKIKFNASKKEKGELYVVVIGESLNRYNMSLYGHFRNTTPKQLEQVKKDNLLVFKNAYANAGNTMRALSYTLTEANQYNNKNFLESLSFIDIFNKAGFDTYWITTQGIIGESNTILSVIANSSKHIIDIGNSINVNAGFSTYYDESTINELKKHISTDKNTLIIIHIYGSHYHYQDRYPKEYEKFKNTLPYMIGTNKELTLDDYSAYDNSVYYNDYVISSLLNIVKSRGGVSSFIYFSDHAEDIARHKGHTARIDGFTFGMINIPLTAWFSKEYIKRYPNTYKTINLNRDKLFSNDLVYDTIIGLAHIKTNHYGAKYDLSSSKYQLNPNEAMTLHSRMHYNSPKNYYFWREYNTKVLKDNNISKKIVITNADYVGNFNEAWQLGFRNFELNLKYIQTKNSFQTGTKKFDTKGNLIDLLSFFKVNQINHLFLNLTNLNQSNIKDIATRLDYINNRLNLKDKTTLIINKADLAKNLQQKGWSIALDSNNSINLNNTDYILADSKLYKQLIDKNSIIINNFFNIADSKLNNKLKEIQEYNSNNRVKFIFANFTSVFNK